IPASDQGPGLGGGPHNLRGALMSDTMTSSDVAMWEDDMSASGDARVQRCIPDCTDLVYFVLLSLCVFYAMTAYPQAMDVYEKAILAGAVPMLVWMGWLWRPLRTLTVVSGLVALGAIWLYSGGGGLHQGGITRAESVFLLTYLLSSQCAIPWMCALFVLATVSYWIGFVSNTAAWLGSGLTWAAVYAGTIGMLVRWREGHLLGPDIGHIPVSNLYEVFVLFALITALFYLYYERRYATRALGGFVLLVIKTAVVFLLWYSFTRDAFQIQPLVPALKSWWMELHVPVNFVGYGGFALSAMVGCAFLVKVRSAATSLKR